MANDEAHSDAAAVPSSQAVAERIVIFAKDCAEDGPLDARARQLLRLAAAVGAGSANIRMMVEEALSNGCGPAELDQTVMLAFESVGSVRGLESLKLVRDSITEVAARCDVKQ